MKNSLFIFFILLYDLIHSRKSKVWISNNIIVIAGVITILLIINKRKRFLLMCIIWNLNFITSMILSYVK